MSLDQLPINLFDFVLVAVLVIGVLRGRKNGMSEELLSLLMWLTILFLGAIIYEPAGKFLHDTSPFSLLSSYVMVYIASCLLVWGVFLLIKRGLGGKLLGSDLFGKAEYYLGMGSGLVRAICMLLTALALLNARFFSVAEVKAMEAFQNDVYGSNFFPGLHSLQSTVFERSLTGPWIKENLGFFLIKSTAPDNTPFKQKEFEIPK